jgi:hypothetical protein
VNYTWRIVKLGLSDELNHEGNLLENAIVNVQWKRIAEDTDGTTASYVGKTDIDAKSTNLADFVALNDVTSEQVISWIEEELSEFELQRINDQLNKKIERSRLRKITPNWR